MIYFAQPTNGGPIRIGSSADVGARKRVLSSGIPGGIEIVAEIDGGETGEYFLHEAFAPIRFDRDWFRSCRPMWAFILDIDANGRPDWIPAEPQTPDRVSVDEVAAQFGSLKSAVTQLGYANNTALLQAINNYSSRAFLLPARLAFWRALKAQRLPGYIVDLYPASDLESAA